MGIFSRKVETRSQFIDVAELTGDSGNFADTTVTPDSALRLSSVWAAIRLLADSISSMPIDVFRNGEEIPAPPLLVSPGAGQNLGEFLYGTMVSLLLRGNAYGFITARSGPRLTPSQVELVNPDLMSVNVDQFGAVTYRYRGQEVDPSDLWHVRAFVYPGNPIGLSPITYAAETLGLSLAVQRFGRAFFADGATPSGLLSVEQNMDDAMVELVRVKLDRATHGRRQPLIVSGGGAGEVKWQSLSINPEESQFVQSRKLGVSEIARTFGVPPEMIGGEAGNSLTYANTTQRSLEFVRYSLSPWMVRLEKAIGTLLPRGQSVKFNPNSLLRGTTLERYQAHQIALASGWLTIDEVRALEDLPPMPAASSPPNLQAMPGGTP
jgi:HK97 family phage portal protein